MQNEQNQNQTTATYDPDSESLERQPAVVESSPEAAGASTGANPEVPASPPKPEPKAPKKKRRRIKDFLRKFNIYLLLFVLLMVLAIIIAVVSFIKSNQADKDNIGQTVSEPLSQEALNQLRQTDVKIGDPKQVLTVDANAVFAGRVLIRDSLEVAGDIRTGGTISGAGLNISGNSIFNQVQASQLQVGGNATIQGLLAVQNNLSVSGSANISGTLTAGALNIQDLQINGDLKLSRHIDAGGPTPGRTNGSALGAGGTSSVSGTDTAGTITLNTGGGPGAGCFITVNFAQRFNDTPHVVVTPVGSAGAGLNYYVTRNSSNFSLCTTNGAPGGQNFAFDYIVID